MREKRFRELKMRDIIREITFYACFLTTVFIVGSPCIDSNAYNIRSVFNHRFTYGLQPEDNPSSDNAYAAVCT